MKQPCLAGHAPSGAVRGALAVRFRDRGHPALAAAAGALAVLIGLAAVPVVFVAADHAFVVACLNAVFDLVGL